MAGNSWGLIPNEDPRTAEEKLAELMRKAQAAGQEAGGRITNAYEDATEDTMADKLRGFADSVNSADNGILGQAGNLMENIQRRGGRALDALGRPSDETPVGTVVREAKEGLMDVVSPKPSMSERFGGLMDSAKGTVSNMMEEKPNPNIEGRRTGDVWIEDGFLYRMTPDGVEYRKTPDILQDGR